MRCGRGWLIMYPATIRRGGAWRQSDTGPGGPGAPTGKSTRPDYVYVMQFTGDQISHLTKIWHSGLAMKELSWA